MNEITRHHEYVSKDSTSLICLKITEINFDLVEIEKFISDYVLNIENLKFIFGETDLTNEKQKSIYRRFILLKHIDNLEEYIKSKLSTNRSFYSFFAEGLLSLVYRDLFGYSLISESILLGKTLDDVQTGVDVCMMDKDKNHIVLAEAKFYDAFDGGIKQIIKDFSKSDSLINKVENLFRVSLDTGVAQSVWIKNNMDGDISKMFVSDFLKLDLNFCGFVLHGNDIDLEKYSSDDFYKNYEIDGEKVTSKLVDLYDLKKKGNYHVTICNLPVNSKKDLIKKVIEKAQEIYNSL